MKDSRPVNLDLTTIRFPITAIASILHRLSGIFIFLCIPFLLYYFDLSLSSSRGFAEIRQCLSGGWNKFFVWLFLSAFAYHFVAGIKHLIMDLGIGEGRESGKVASWIALTIAAVLIILMGYWIWA